MTTELRNYFALATAGKLRGEIPDLSTKINRLRRSMFLPEFYLGGTVGIARELIGAAVVRMLPDGDIAAGIITETEAYLHTGDAASHSARGQTPRNRSMFAAGGTLYVYKIYGVHHCINAVTGAAGVGSAVLIRAAAPFAGIAGMQERRGKNVAATTLCRGPGNLARAFGFTTTDDGASLCSEDLFLAKIGGFAPEIAISPRVGITKAGDLPLRFFAANSPVVS